MIAVISDVHSNLEAFQAVLHDIKKRKIEKVLCLGDLVGYGPNPNEVISIFKRENIFSILGNHDKAVITKNTSGFNFYAARAILWTCKEILQEQVEFLKNLEEVYKDKEIYMVHGSPLSPLVGYIFPEDVTESLTQYGEVVLLGHTHIPFIKRFKNNLVLNPGSVGQPRDKDPRASYATLNLEKREAEIIRVPYKISKTYEKIIDKGLPKILGDRLFRGI